METKKTQIDYKCEYCDKSGSCRDHKCGKGFLKSEEMKKHIHKDKTTPKICDSCGQSFSRTDNWKTHMKTVHALPLNIKCELCSKHFANENSLRKHIKAIHECTSARSKCDLSENHIPQYLALKCT